jgi:hypothetical protein
MTRAKLGEPIAGRPNTNRAPRVGAPRAFVSGGVGFGVLALAAIAVRAKSMVAGAALAPETVATVHLLTLGFLTSVMMGALYQWVPVIAGGLLAHEGWAWVHAALHGVGVGFFVGGLATVTPWAVAIGGSLLLAGVALFLVNMGETVAASPLPRPASLRLVTTALWGLALAAAAGAAMAVPLAGIPLTVALTRILPAHLILAVGGWLGMTLIGVSWRLFPMFWGVKPSTAGLIPAWAAGVGAVGVGLVGILTDLAPLTGIAAGMGAVALGIWIVHLAKMWRRRPRGAAWDGAKGLMAAAPLTLVVSLAAGVWCWRSGRWLDGLVLVLVGGVSLSMLAYLQRILPFMTWLSASRRWRRAPHLPALWPEPWSWGVSAAGVLAFLVLAAGFVSGTPWLVQMGSGTSAGAWAGLLVGAVRMARLSHPRVNVRPAGEI